MIAPLVNISAHKTFARSESLRRVLPLDDIAASAAISAGPNIRRLR
jgi:hypothetical protein